MMHRPMTQRTLAPGKHAIGTHLFTMHHVVELLCGKRETHRLWISYLVVPHRQCMSRTNHPAVTTVTAAVHSSKPCCVPDHVELHADVGYKSYVAAKPIVFSVSFVPLSLHDTLQSSLIPHLT